MLYLFLTGKNNAYLDDIFTTLYLPAGMLHSYKYNCRADTPIIDPSIWDKLKAGEDVLISCVDREAVENERLNIPLRMGQFVKHVHTDGQCYFEVRLLELCYAKQEEKFSKNLLRVLDNKIYRRTENTADSFKGFLALYAADTLAGELETNDKAWFQTAERLSGRILFKDSYSIFTRLEIQNADGRTVEPVERGGESGYELSAGKKYRLMLSYYIPGFNNNVMTRIPVMLEEDCGALQVKHYMESRQNKIVTRLYPEGADEQKNTVLSVTIPQADVNGKTIRYSPAGVNVWIKSRMSKKIRTTLTVLCGLGIAAASVLAGFSYDDLKEQGGLMEVVRSGKALYQLSGGFLAAVSTYFMIKLTGKPKL